MIGIIDYGMGNLHSVYSACQYLEIRGHHFGRSTTIRTMRTLNITRRGSIWGHD